MLSKQLFMPSKGSHFSQQSEESHAWKSENAFCFQDLLWLLNLAHDNWNQYINMELFSLSSLEFPWSHFNNKCLQISSGTFSAGEKRAERHAYRYRKAECCSSKQQHKICLCTFHQIIPPVYSHSKPQLKPLNTKLKVIQSCKGIQKQTA